MPCSPTLADTLRAQPFELILSSGFFGFYAHTGVVAALEEAGLAPSLVGGSSAGAMIAALVAAGIPATAIAERLFAIRREDFWDLDPRFGLRLGGAGPGLLRGRAFDRLLEETLHSVGAREFADCKTPVRIVVFDVAARATVVLDRGPLAPAVRASCSLPGMFQPVVLDGRRYLDGGIGDRAGMRAATPGVRVLFHHLAARRLWRRVFRGQNQPPARDNTIVLCAPDAPSVNPFALERGPSAFAAGRDMARAALAAPASPTVA